MQNMPHINVFDIFWLFLILLSFMPLMRQRMLEAARLKIMRKIEKNRGSRVITMIHRQESRSLLGIPFMKFIDMEDSESVLRAIRMTPKDVPIDFIIHTPGGLVLAAKQIAHALMKHPAKVTVFVPHFAMSGGTLIALAADEVVMDENAVLGPVDPQIGQMPAASIVSVLEKKPVEEIDDNTLILADVSKKALEQMRQTVKEILMHKGWEEKRAEEVAEILSQGKWTHDYPLMKDDLEKLGIKVSTDMPEEIYALMDLYEQPMSAKSSVQYIPVPYRPAGNSAESSK